MRADEIDIFVDGDESEDPYFLVELATRDGSLLIMGEIEFGDSHLIVRGMHIGGNPAVKRGWSRLRMLGRMIAEKLDVDYIEIHGAVRTTGANPGRRPRRVRLSRPAESDVPTRREHS